MSSWTKSVSGAVSTYTITDGSGATGTVTVTQGATTGNTTALSATALHNDGLAIVVELLNLISTGLIPNQSASSASSFT